jgi:voltage-gated sodium channel
MSQMEAAIAANPGWRTKLHERLESGPVQRLIIAVIILNGIILGLETSPPINNAFGGLLRQIDRLCLTFFVVEISLALVAMGPRFFRDPWRIFDFTVVGIALLPAAGAFSVLRSLRILRVLRLISAAPQMRSVVQALLAAIPGLSSICFLLLLIFYVAAVIVTNLFSAAFPEWFGSIGASLYTLFQVMTLESWSMGIVRPVMETFPLAWMYFLPFILIATFMMLNLFIAVVVNAMQATHDQEALLAPHSKTEQLVLDELRALRAEVAELRKQQDQ